MTFISQRQTIANNDTKKVTLAPSEFFRKGYVSALSGREADDLYDDNARSLYNSGHSFSTNHVQFAPDHYCCALLCI